MGKKGRTHAKKEHSPTTRPVQPSPQRSEIQSIPADSQVRTASSPATNPADFLSLQRTLGNRAVQKMMPRRSLTLQRAPTPDASQTLEQAEAILADCKRDLHYKQVKLALASGRNSLQRKMMTFLVDWRYGFTDYWAKISPMNKNQWEIHQGFGEIKSTMVKYEDQVRARQKDPRWRYDTRAERAVSILKRYRFRVKRNPQTGRWTVWVKFGDVHFKHITNDQLLKVSKRMVRWARAKQIAPIVRRYKLGLTKTNVKDDYQDLKSIKIGTKRWRQDLKATRKICRQIMATFDPKTGIFKARDGWELKVLSEVDINESTRFKHILRSYTKARNRADARAAYIGLQAFAKSKSGSLEGDPKDPGITAAERRKILHVLDF